MGDLIGIKTVSLFSGAGGLDCGAIQAGARIVFANDMMKEACETYRKNIGDHIIYGDLNEHLEELEKYKDADLVIGGPPCQGFSVAGKMDAEDKRSQLVWTYTKVVSIIKPRAFVMENVKALGLLEKWSSVREGLLEKFRSLGYSVNFMILNASDFDVPQARERVFFVGFRIGSSTKQPDLLRMIEPYRHKSESVRNVLLTLDKRGTGNNTGICKAKISVAKNPVLRKSAYAGMLFNGLGRPLKLDGYSATLPASMGGNKTPIVDDDALYKGKEPWVEVYHSHLINDPTLSLRTVVPSCMRRLTVEEAALLQTFPRDYVFCGPQSSKFTQIGNAVPCNLAKAVCSMVIDVLTEKKPLITL